MEFSPAKIQKLNHGLKNGNLTIVSMEGKRKQVSVLHSVQPSKKSAIWKASRYRLLIEKKKKKLKKKELEYIKVTQNNLKQYERQAKI